MNDGEGEKNKNLGKWCAHTWGGESTLSEPDQTLSEVNRTTSELNQITSEIVFSTSEVDFADVLSPNAGFCLLLRCQGVGDVHECIFKLPTWLVQPISCEVGCFRMFLRGRIGFSIPHFHHPRCCPFSAHSHYFRIKRGDFTEKCVILHGRLSRRRRQSAAAPTAQSYDLSADYW